MFIYENYYMYTTYKCIVSFFIGITIPIKDLDGANTRKIKLNLSGNRFSFIIPWVIFIAFLYSCLHFNNNIAYFKLTFFFVVLSLLFIINLWNVIQASVDVKQKMLFFCNCPILRVFFENGTKKNFHYVNIMSEMPNKLYNQMIDLKVKYEKLYISNLNVCPPMLDFIVKNYEADVKKNYNLKK